MGKAKVETYNQRDIQAILNNAVLRTMAPSRIGPIYPGRLRQLRDYTEVLIEPIFEHIEQGYLKPEEAVALFSIAALLMQMRVMGTMKGAPALNLLFEEDDDDVARSE